MNARRLIVLPGLLSTLWAAAAGASEVKIFRTDSQEAVLKGTLEGLAVDPLGGIELARRLERLASIDEPFVFSAAALGDGWVVGTGSSGKVLRLGPGGEVAELHAAAEPEVFAVWADDDGTVLAATSPDGRVTAISNGEAEVVFDPEDRYVWDLARDAEGRLLVATGLAGRLYRLGADGKAEVLYESPDSHVRAIAALPGGGVLLGTAGQGLIVRLGADGAAATLHDAVHPEVLDFAVAPSGRAYAAVLASEASLVDLSATAVAPSAEKPGESAGEAKVTVVVQGQETVGSRSATFTGPRSVVLEISPEGKVEQIAAFQSETVHALLWQDGGLWIGTGQEGRLYRWSDRRLVQQATLEDRQIAGLVAGPAGVAAVTANASALYRLHPDSETEGTFTSAVLDAAQAARFGSFLWHGVQPRGAELEVALRTGMSAVPDATWSPWIDGGAVRCAGCGGGDGRDQELALGEVPHGRYVQWRSRLRRGGAEGPRLESAELSYRQENLRPRITKLEVLDPGQILVPASFNPQNQTFEPWSPNREGIFTTLRLEASSNGEGRLKNLWKKGYRTLQWTAEDDNGDPLVYRLDFRPDEERDAWLPMVEEIKETQYGFDSTVLPDGVYRFRLRASDGAGRWREEALADEKESESVVIDHTPPALVSSERRDGAIVLELADALSPIRDVAVSVDAGEWRPAQAADGILDGRRETLRVEVPAAARLVLLRASDAAHNVITFKLLKTTR